MRVIFIRVNIHGSKDTHSDENKYNKFMGMRKKCHLVMLKFTSGGRRSESGAHKMQEKFADDEGARRPDQLYLTTQSSRTRSFTSSHAH